MKRILIVPLLLIVIESLSAQQFKIGVFADPQITWLKPDSRNTSSTGSVMGIDGGVLFDKYFQKNYAFQTGVSLGTVGGGLQFGNHITFTAYGEDTTLAPGTSVDYRLNYISVPVGLKLRTNQIGYFSYFARLGFLNQFNIDARATSSDGALNDSDISKEIFFYDLSYYFGLGVQYNLSEDTALLMALNYNSGFIDVTSDDDIKAFTRSISLRIGIIF